MVYSLIQVQSLQTLLTSGSCDISLTDNYGTTAARVAEIYGQKECLKLIAEHMEKHGQSSQ